MQHSTKTPLSEDLKRLVGQPVTAIDTPALVVDLHGYVNGTLVAHGEVVVINEKFGIRLTDVISPAERVRKLR